MHNLNVELKTNNNLENHKNLIKNAFNKLDKNNDTVDQEMSNVKELKYKVTDLLYSIERGNKDRVLAHLKLGTPTNEKTNVHRDFSHSYTAIEYAQKLGKTDMLELMQNY